MPIPLPNALRMREIKFGPKVSREEKVRAARAQLAAGRSAEALDLFLIAGEEKAVEEMRREAVAKGRVLLLLMLQRAGRPPASGEWRAAGDAAFADQRWREAFRAYTFAGWEEGLARVKEKIPDYEIFTPQGK